MAGKPSRDLLFDGVFVGLRPDHLTEGLQEGIERFWRARLLRRVQHPWEFFVRPVHDLVEVFERDRLALPVDHPALCLNEVPRLSVEGDERRGVSRDHAVGASRQDGTDDLGSERLVPLHEPRADLVGEGVLDLGDDVVRDTLGFKRRPHFSEDVVEPSSRS